MLIHVDLHCKEESTKRRVLVQTRCLPQVQVKLREKGLTEDFQLRWRKQPDGKIFHKEEEESSQRKRKRRERKPALTKREL